MPIKSQLVFLQYFISFLLDIYNLINNKVLQSVQIVISGHVSCPYWEFNQFTTFFLLCYFKPQPTKKIHSENLIDRSIESTTSVQITWCANLDNLIEIHSRVFKLPFHSANKMSISMKFLQILKIAIKLLTQKK